MVKETLASLAVWALLLSACSCKTSVPKLDRAQPDSSPPQQPWKFASDVKSPSRLWGRPTGGLVVDLDVSGDGSTVLASTIPDFDADGGAGKHQVQSFSHLGKLNFRKFPKAPVKAQALSRDGSRAFVSTYDDSLTAYGKRGKALWRVSSVCKPVPLNQLKRVLCFHDDDAEPKVAFDVLDWDTGRRLSSYPIHDDVLALKVAPDEGLFAIALSGGVLEVFGPNLRFLWRKQFEGEVLDFSLSNGPKPLIALLTSRGKLLQLSSEGGVTASIQPSSRMEQVTVLGDGSAIFTYGNGKAGQALHAFRPAQPGTGLLEIASHNDPVPAQYNAPLLSTSQFAVLRFEGSGHKASDNHLLGLNSSFGVRWSVPLEFGEGLALYAQSFNSGFIALSTEDGRVEAFRNE